MRSVLSAPRVDGSLVLGAPRGSQDPAVVAELERVAAEHYERGLAAGAERAVANARDAATSVLATLQPELAAMAETLGAARGSVINADLELGLAIGEAVAGRTPPPSATELVDRLRDALAEVDDPALVVHVAPSQHDVIASALKGPGIEVIADPTVADGQARVEGVAARVDISREAALETLRELLEAERDG